jgi:hypothetical protein
MIRMSHFSPLKGGNEKLSTTIGPSGGAEQRSRQRYVADNKVSILQGTLPSWRNRAGGQFHLRENGSQFSSGKARRFMGSYHPRLNLYASTIKGYPCWKILQVCIPSFVAVAVVVLFMRLACPILAGRIYEAERDTHSWINPSWNVKLWDLSQKNVFETQFVNASTSLSC